MNKWNNFETLEHFRGYIWISKELKETSKGNVCVLQDGQFKVLAYIEPSRLEKQDLESLIHNIVKANGTLWMLEEEDLITCTVCNNMYEEEQVNIVDFEDDVCVYCEETYQNSQV